MSDFDDLEEEFLDGVSDDEFAETGKLIAGVSDEERKKRREVMDKRTGKDLERKWQQEDREALAEAESLAAPPVITVAQCQVCQSPHRVWIERKLMQGHSYQSIAASIPDGSVSRKSVANHWKNHMALDAAATRAMLEEEADLLGQNVEEGVRGAFTLRGSLEVLIRKAFQDAQDGVTTVEPRDLIQMVKLLNELNVNTGSTAVEEAKLAINIFKESIQNVLIKGDIIEREVGMRLLEAIQDEANRLREEQAADALLDRHLQLPPA